MGAASGRASLIRKWRLRAVAGVLGLGFLGLVAHGCVSREGQLAPVAPPNLPPWLGPSSIPFEVQPVDPVAAVPGTVADPNAPHFDPAAIVPIVDDPRLAAVKTALAREADKAAAAALDDTLAAETSPDPAWNYQLGRLRARAGEPGRAIEAYDRAAAADWPLADHARYQAGRMLAQIEQPAEALARLDAIELGTPLDDSVALAKADALAASRRIDEAADVWDAYLARSPRPGDWQVVALRYAKALLNQPSVARAERAVGVARIVIYESPGGRGVGEARDLEKRALETIPSQQRGPLIRPEVAELVARARALGEARQSREAVAAADKLIKELGDAAHQPGEASCEAYLARARGLAERKRYSEASQDAGVAVERCGGHPRRVVALFLGGRYALRSGQKGVARRHYALLEKTFPEHSYADDARLHGAEAALDLGDHAAFTEMLSAIDEAYPHGDMVDQALFTLAQARIDAGDWAGAVQPLERAVKHKHRGRPYYAEGRPHYFLARARLELGLRDEGIAMLAQVIRDFPLSYFMVLAYNRLEAEAPQRAKQALGAAIAAEPQGQFVIPDHEELHRPGFLRAVELVRQGDGPRALAELDALGVRNQSAHPSLLWAGALLLARIDAPAESHGVLRSSTHLWKEHYPAGVWRDVWQVAYPRPFKQVVDREVARSGTPAELAYAIMREESAFRPRAVSHAGAYGLMQLIVPTAKRMADPLNLPSSIAALKRPEVNIALGCRFLSQLRRRFDYNPLLAIPGYNAGPGRPIKWVDQRPEDDFDLWVERIPFRETRHYTKRVIGTLAAYALLYGDGMDSEIMQVPLKVQPRP